MRPTLSKSANSTLKFSIFLWLAIVSILLLSAVLLIRDLTATSLWADEGWTIAATAESNPIKVVTEWVAEDVHPPLFFMELNIWRKLTGDTIFAMRYYSVLITLTGVALMYQLGTSMFSERAGILAALFLGMHDLVRVLTQEVRHYPQQQTTTVLAMWLYWRFWQRPTRKRGIAFAVGGAVLIWSHYWGGFVLLAMAIHAGMTRWKQLKVYVFAFGGIGLLYIPWLPALYHQITIERPSGLPHALENSWVVYRTLAFQLAGTPELFWIVLGIVGTLGVFIIKRPKEWLPTTASGLPAMIIILTVGLSLLVNTQYATLSFRSLAVIIPPLMILVAHALAQFRLQEQVIMVVFIVIQSLATTSAQPIERPPWPDMAEFVAQHTTSDERILLELDTDEHSFWYYLDRSGADVRYISTEDARNRDAENFDTFLADELADVDGVWVPKFGFENEIRGALEAQGFVVSTPMIEWERYVDGRPIELWRYDHIDHEAENVFGGVMRLMRSGVTQHETWVTVNLLWSPTETLDRNYTISAFLLRPGSPPFPIDLPDSYPMEGRSPTIDWVADGMYFDSRVLSTEGVPAGTYMVGLKVYYFLDNNFTQLEIAPAEDCSTNTSCEFIFLDTIDIQ